MHLTHPMRRAVAPALTIVALGGGVAFASDAIKGTDGDDTLSGTPTADRIFGKAGNDTIDGLAGDDLLHGGKGDDTLAGGEGDDLLHGGQGDDTLDGGAGDDRLLAAFGRDTVAGGDGDDKIVAKGHGKRHGKSWHKRGKKSKKARRSEAVTAGHTIDAGAGDDRIDVRNGLRDAVTCGDGTDAVKADRDDEVAADCEKVLVKGEGRRSKKHGGHHHAERRKGDHDDDRHEQRRKDRGEHDERKDRDRDDD